MDDLTLLLAPGSPVELNSDLQKHRKTTPPRVLHCLWSAEAGGLERAVYQLVRHQLRVGRVAPSVLFAGGRGPWFERIEGLGCPVTALEMPSGRSLHRLPAAIRLMRSYDIHHFHAAEPVLIVASLGCKGVRRVYTHRGGQGEYPFRQGLRYTLAAALMRWTFHGFSANSAHGGGCAADLLRIESGRFRVTYNGIEFALLEPERPATDVRMELGLASTDFVLGTVSILRAWKRIGRLLELVASLADTRLRLVIVGDGPERAALEAQTRSLAIDDSVVFTGLRHHVPDYLQIMDCFCLPATKEGFGNSAVEAMALGVPTVVFSDGGGLLEHIEHGQTGFIVADQDELERTVRRLIADPDLRESIGTRGRDAVRARYTPERSAASYDDLYSAVLTPCAE